MKTIKRNIVLTIVMLTFLTSPLMLQAEKWTSIGPDGARITSLAIDPKVPSILYLGTEWSGLFKSVDGGAQWIKADNGLTTSRIESLSVDPSNPSIVYAGTALGVFKSIDGAMNWILSGLEGKSISCLAIDSKSPSTLYAGTGPMMKITGSLYKSVDGGATWMRILDAIDVWDCFIFIKIDPKNPLTLYAGSEYGGIYKSFNGGAEWAKINSGLTIRSMLSFMINPTNTLIIYAGTAQGGIFKSADGGSNWMPVNSGLSNFYVSSLAIDPVNPSIIYAGTRGGVFKSTDEAGTWTSINNGLAFKVLNALEINPQDPLIIYAGTHAGGVFKSTDGGDSWAESNVGLRNTYINCIVRDPLNPSIIYAGGDDGGLYKSIDNGTTWAIKNNGLSYDITCLVINPKNSSIVYAGTWTDGVYKSIDGGYSWNKTGILSNPYVHTLVIDPWNPSTLYAGTGGGIFKSSDSGGSWIDVSEPGSPFGTSLAIDPFNPSTVYAGYAGYYSGISKSIDGGKSWTTLNSSLYPSVIILDPITPLIVYVGSSDGVYRSKDGGLTWNLLSTGLPSNPYVNALFIHPKIKSLIYAGTSSRGIFRTTDGGNSWTEINDGLPIIYPPDSYFAVSSLIAEDNPLKVYAATSGAGIYSTSSDSPWLTLSRDKLNFGALEGAAATSSQHVWITNSGEGAINWTISPSESWIEIKPVSGTGDRKIEVSVNPTGLSEGIYNGSVSVSDPGAANSPQTISIELKVYREGTSLSPSPPFGYFDTPVDGSIVSGSIAVTGWALDDLEVKRVEIKRYPDPDDPPGAIGVDGLIYIGDAFFVDGARPDVELAYPGYPLNYQAGWGYMLLTYGLPRQGNGTFKLYAIAIDGDGHGTELGQKTIISDNAHATLPFGALDFPGQGETVSGSDYVNFGWALTPMPKSIPTDGSTILLWIDGLPVGHPTYNDLRPDIATLFPGFANSNGGGGHYYLDTTQYANGVHTIAWSVEDSAGISCGIGSRYFTVVNTGAGSAADLGDFSSLSLSGKSGNDSIASRAGIANIPTDYLSPVYVKKGYHPEALSEVVFPDEKGVINIEAREVDRIEIALGESTASKGLMERIRDREKQIRVSANKYYGTRDREKPVGVGDQNYVGYLIVGKELRPLPIGSTLDSGRGVFSWQLGPGFVGDYNFVFISQDGSGIKSKKNIKVRILPAHSTIK
jgi:photosystem II stability/assembly factor-like uncharacterized protein